MPVATESVADLLSSLSQLVRTTRHVAQRQDHALGPSGTPHHLLKALRQGPVRVSDLATRLSLAPSVVSRAIGTLEEKGLVERNQDPDDARSWQIALTDPGQLRLAAVQQAYVERLTGVLDAWDDADILEAARLMRKLQETIAEETTDDTFSTVDLPLMEPHGRSDGGTAELSRITPR